MEQQRVVPRILRLMLLASLPLFFVGVIAFVYSTSGEGVVVLAFGIIMTMLATLFASVSIARRRWPTTNGVVTHSELKTTPGLFGWRDPDMDSVFVNYAYTVEDRELLGSFRCTPSDDNFKIIGGYPQKGMTVKVHYNPRKPSESLLVTGPGGFNVACFVLGILGIVGGCYLIWS